MIVSAGDYSYEWLDNWARIPDTESGRSNGRTHGVAVTAAGEVVVFCQADPAVLIFDSEGTLSRSWGDRFPGAHGLTMVGEAGNEHLWLTDQNTAEVVKTTLDGETVLSLETPDHPAYAEGGYVPTWAVENEERLGGNGDIWVTDGYGAGLVHRYDKAGIYQGSINGAEGSAGAFQCPHGIWIDTRKSPAELYIADRGNHRVQVYDLAGTFKRCFGEDELTSPDGFVTWGDIMVAPELFSRITLLDAEDRVIGSLGEYTESREVEGWPNLSQEQLFPGKFNSPHGAGVDADGNIYVVEWIVGGRITKLQRVAT